MTTRFFKKDGFFYVERKYDKFTFTLMNYFFLDIKQKGKGKWGWATVGSQKAMKTYRKMKPTKYTDAGDLWYSYKNGIYRVYGKPMGEPYTKEHNIESNKLLTEMNAKVWFPKILKFLKEYQRLDKSGFGIKDKDLSKLHEDFKSKNKK